MNRPLQKIQKIRQFIDSLMDLFQQRGGFVGKEAFDLRKLPQRIFQGDEITAIGHTQGDPRRQSLHIVNLGENPAQIFPEKMILPDFRHGGQPLPNLFRIDEGIIEPPAEAAPPHGGQGFIQDGKEGTGSPIVLNGFEEFEVPFRRFIEKKIIGRRIPLEPMNMPEGILLGFLHVTKNGARRPHHRRMVFQPRVLKAIPRNGGLQAPPGLFPIKIIGGKFIKATGIFSPGQGPKKPFFPMALGQKDLPEFQGRHLRLEKLGIVEVAHPEFSGGNVEEGQTDGSVQRINRRQKVIFFGVEILRIHNQAGRNDPDDLPLNDPFGQFRIFDLFTDRHLESLFNELRDISGQGMIGKAAEGNAVLFSLVSRGEGDLQNFRSGYGVFKKYFVKIPHAEKDDAVRMLVLHLHILLHRRGQAGHFHGMVHSQRSLPRFLKSMKFPPPPSPLFPLLKKAFKRPLTTLISRAPRTAVQNP
ncbi:MAG: hypothetical protein A4E72_01359 [Syntrophus sp. PtaU1.Bin208]|nr:MAG: hypothetical protein A4E72_01359 [Syntrophus sp. PtaU1.Bin208]